MEHSPFASPLSSITPSPVSSPLSSAPPSAILPPCAVPIPFSLRAAPSVLNRPSAPFRVLTMPTASLPVMPSSAVAATTAATVEVPSKGPPRLTPGRLDLSEKKLDPGDVVPALMPGLLDNMTYDWVDKTPALHDLTVDAFVTQVKDRYLPSGWRTKLRPRHPHAPPADKRDRRHVWSYPPWPQPAPGGRRRAASRGRPPARDVIITGMRADLVTAYHAKGERYRDAGPPRLRRIRPGRSITNAAVERMRADDRARRERPQTPATSDINPRPASKPRLASSSTFNQSAGASTSASASANATASSSSSSGLPKMAGLEKELLTLNEGCYTCRVPFAGHRATDKVCSFPNAATYKAPTLASVNTLRAARSLPPLILKDNHYIVKPVAVVMINEESSGESESSGSEEDSSSELSRELPERTTPKAIPHILPSSPAAVSSHPLLPADFLSSAGARALWLEMDPEREDPALCILRPPGDSHDLVRKLHSAPKFKNAPCLAPGPAIPEDAENDEEYEIARIVDERTRYRRKEYLVEWVGWGNEDARWLPEKELHRDSPHLKQWKSSRKDATKPRRTKGRTRTSDAS
ncbi:Reverse transcriptase-RNase H-integrase [Mycena chlorophos]|uniref:Reverse transcriptase-RNase H-integrase n=1 Tax=Mycena chlorophos TaxID=658473 RepID=A0A8H6W551_MYCCL|nr:Reverse transcriptase-RNase H-integrase [Mycena chlorophos]